MVLCRITYYISKYFRYWTVSFWSSGRPTVFGIFLDGYDSQEGIVLGSIPAIPLKSSDQKAYSDQRASFVEFPKINVKVNYDSGIFQSIEDVDQGTYPRYLDAPDTSASAKGDPSAIAALKTASRAAGQIGVPIAFSGTWSEPANPYAARYPFNHVQETESGHIFEMDDTRSKERVHLAHRTGTFLEFLPDGSRVDKAANDQYTIVHRDSFEHVERTKVITVDSGLKILVNKDEGSEGYDLEVKAGGPVNITVRGGNVNLRVENGNVESYINGNLNENITGNVNRTVGGSITVNSGGNQTYVAPIIRLN